MPNSVPILDRLVGLETEYTFRFRPAERRAASPPHTQLYHALSLYLRKQVLTAPARLFKQGVFLANGGAVWFELDRPSTGSGSLRSATPECRGPLEVVRYQRAMDQLVSQSARLTEMNGQLSLLKMDRHASGRAGGHESYEANLGESWRLGCWRLGLLLLMPLVLATWLGLGLLIIGILVYLALAGLIYLPWRWFSSHPQKMARRLFGNDFVDGSETGRPTPAWLEAILLLATRVMHAPLAGGLWLLVQMCAFHRTRRKLLPFLASRAVVTGAGWLTEEGQYVISSNASTMRSVVGLGGLTYHRSVFTFAHFFQAICVESWLSPRDYLQLLRRRQRMQIGLGDTNIADMAEFLRVGTTTLVLDMIEAGELPQAPALRRPLQAIQDIGNDPTLSRTVSLTDGNEWTGLQLQRWYLRACQQFLKRHADAPAEAHEVAAAWEEVLDLLEQVRITGEAPQSLVGSVDWITKRHLLEEAGNDVSPGTRRSIDVCYHELSPLGYFQMLQAAGLAATCVGPRELERAMRTPPANTPATMRGHYIREFSSDSTELTVNWSRVVLGRGLSSKSIRLSRYLRSPIIEPDPPRRDTHDSGRSSAP